MLDDDLAAFRRMRARGLHPSRIDGCAALEASATRESLTWGEGMTVEQVQNTREAMAKAVELFH